ncbi:MAG: methyltransferase domain-containing protein [Steroidobacteraceae bacterium]|nr:methyltransferase domain-containing protein [Steroidobacteraceae bacterium]
MDAATGSPEARAPLPGLADPAQDTGIAAVADLLACPRCRAALQVWPEGIRCSGCSSRYPFHEGIPLLAIRGTSETWGQAQATEQSSAYQAEYQRVENAATYNLAYRDKLLKRSSTRREYELIARHIARVGRSRVILDLPCGGGRLTAAFAGSADLVIEADIALGQLLYGRAESAVATPRAWMTASAFHIPLRDQSVDGTVSVRLSHHLPTAAERERHLAELLRVSRRFVIMTFFDHHSLKNRLRQLRRPFDRQPPKMTMTTARVAEIARAHGARLVDAPPLSRIGSGHRYALIVRDAVPA